ncbi:hypothetical protein HY631_02330 [Candidatus Uhrbacteria bacterium]|nr:hypothetical protein [Candidatus Uhrbacteria bacterium]
MTHLFRASLSGFLAFALFLSLIPSASAHQSVTSYLPASFSTWSTYGSPSVSSDRALIEGAQSEWVWIDLDASELAASTIAIASYADKSDRRTSGTASQRNSSGNPYIYAYAMDGNGKIVKYLSGTSLMATTRADADQVVFGIFPIMSGVKTVRVFLKQTSVNGISNTGADVAFMRPVLVKAPSGGRAMDLVKAYARQNLDLTYRNITK